VAFRWEFRKQKWRPPPFYLEWDGSLIKKKDIWSPPSLISTSLSVRNRRGKWVRIRSTAEDDAIPRHILLAAMARTIRWNSRAGRPPTYEQDEAAADVIAAYAFLSVLARAKKRVAAWEGVQNLKGFLGQSDYS
jgi:hypothetical protein